MGNYSSTWTELRALPTGPLYQAIAGKEPDLDEAHEMSPAVASKLPAEVWADIIAFLSFQDKVTPSPRLLSWRS